MIFLRVFAVALIASSALDSIIGTTANAQSFNPRFQVDSDRFREGEERSRLDPSDRIRLQDREKQLLHAFDELRDADSELQKRIDFLQKKQDEVQKIMRDVRLELKATQTQLL